MIVFDNVSKRYANGHIGLHKVNLHIEQGEMAFLTGHSGAGKSTLLKLIMLMDRPTVGRIFVGGYSLANLRRAQIPALRQNIGLVLQDPQLRVDRSVFENVAIPMQVAGFSQADTGRRVRAALDMVGLLKYEKINPLSLSSGERQRVGIARALVVRPPLLLADEPTGNLDPQLSADIMERFMHFNQNGMTVLIATHDLTLVQQMGHRVISLAHGSLASPGASAQ